MSHTRHSPSGNGVPSKLSVTGNGVPCHHCGTITVVLVVVFLAMVLSKSGFDVRRFLLLKHYYYSITSIISLATVAPATVLLAFITVEVFIAVEDITDRAADEEQVHHLLAAVVVRRHQLRLQEKRKKRKKKRKKTLRVQC